MDWGEILLDACLAAVGPVAAAYALAAIGLNLQFGYTGLLNFGYVAFMLLGAYGLAVTVDLGGSFWLGLMIRGDGRDGARLPTRRADPAVACRLPRHRPHLGRGDSQAGGEVGLGRATYKSGASSA